MITYILHPALLYHYALSGIPACTICKTMNNELMEKQRIPCMWSCKYLHLVHLNEAVMEQSWIRSMQQSYITSKPFVLSQISDTLARAAETGDQSSGPAMTDLLP